MSKKKQTKMPYIRFPKGTTKKQKAIVLQKMREAYGLDPWVEKVEQSVQEDNKHKNHECYLTLITFKNNTTHFGLFCAECEHKNFITWVSKKDAKYLLETESIAWRDPVNHLARQEHYAEPVREQISEPNTDPNYRLSGDNLLPNL